MGQQRRDGHPQRAVFITGEPAAGLSTRDGDQPWGTRGMKQQRREGMGGSGGFAGGDRICSGAGASSGHSGGSRHPSSRACGQTQSGRRAAVPFCRLSFLGEREVGSAAAHEDGDRHLRTEGEGQPAGREGEQEGREAARTTGSGLREPTRGPRTGTWGQGRNLGPGQAGTALLQPRSSAAWGGHQAGFHLGPHFAQQTSLVAQMVKHLPTMRETRVRSLGREDFLEKAMAIHSTTLAWRIPWTEEPGRLQSTGVTKSRT